MTKSEPATISSVAWPLDEPPGPVCDQVAQILDTIVSDYRDQRGPFANVQTTLPEIDHVRSIPSGPTRRSFATFGSALDYNRPAGAHWETMEMLFEDEPGLFDPDAVVTEYEPDEMASIFDQDKYWVRYPNRDAEFWTTIAETLVDRFDGSVGNLLSEYEYDAQRAHDGVRSMDGMPVLGGPKICPMWLRILSDTTRGLEGLETLPIPVDAQIRKVTSELVQRPLDRNDDDLVRDFWDAVCADSQYQAVRIDAPLWLLGRDYEDWGRSYLSRAVAGSNPAESVDW